MRAPRASAVRMELDGGRSCERCAGPASPPDLTHHAYHALDSHITGFTLWQVSMPFETKEELVDLAAAS